MTEYIAAGGLTLASSHCIDLPKDVKLYKSPGTVGGTLSRDATVDYLGLSGGFYFVLVNTADRDFYADGVARTTQVLVNRDEFTARPRPKTAAELVSTASRYGADDTPFDQADIDAALEGQAGTVAQLKDDLVAAQTAAGNAAGMERERIAAAEAARIRAL